MKGLITVLILIPMLLTAVPAVATQSAIIPAYAYVSDRPSSMKEYKALIDKQNRVGARKLLHARKVFLSPKDIRVEVVNLDENIAKVKLDRLNDRSERVTLYFWTLADQLRFLPQ